MSDTQLTQEERYQIHALLKAGHAQSETAMILSRTTSTISREIRRNTGLCGYRPKQAQCLAMERRQSRAQTRIHTATWSQVEKRLKQDWSPMKSAFGAMKHAVFLSVMNGSTSTSSRTKPMAAICSVTCVVRNNAVNAMAAIAAVTR